MLLGMTHAELALVVFIFALVCVAQVVPRVGAFVGRKLAGKSSPRLPPGP
jgi:hypothetical protein